MSGRGQVKKRRGVVAFPVPREEAGVRGMQHMGLDIRFKLERRGQRADNIRRRTDLVLMFAGIGFRGKGLVTALMGVDMGMNLKMISKMQVQVMKMRALTE